MYTFEFRARLNINQFLHHFLSFLVSIYIFNIYTILHTPYYFFLKKIILFHSRIIEIEDPFEKRPTKRQRIIWRMRASPRPPPQSPPPPSPPPPPPPQPPS